MTQARPAQPIDHPSAWRRADIERNQSWQHTLTDADIDELERAAAGVANRGFRFGRADFPLPTLGPRLESILAEAADGRGFAVMRGLPLDRYDRPTIEAIYWGMATHWGNLISQNAKGDLIAEVTDKGSDYTGGVNDRGYISRDRLQPHVDTSDVTCLLCLYPARTGGHSSVVSSLSIYNTIMTERPDLLDMLHRGFHHDLRGEGPTRRLDEVTHNRIPVYSWHEGLLSCCFNAKIMRSAHAKMGQPLSPAEDAALEYIMDVAERPELRFDLFLERGDIQLINNYVLFHWRTAFEDFPEPERKRCLLRLWLNTRKPRPLAAEFSDRYNTGPRGGVYAGADAAD